MIKIEIDKNKLQEICNHNDILSLGLFGSFAKGNSTSKSDVDLLVSFSKAKSLLELVRIERSFSNLLGRKADLHTEKSLSPYLRDRIKAELKIIYEQTR